MTPLADTSARLWHWGRYGFGWEDAGMEMARFRSYSYRTGGCVAEVHESDPGGLVGSRLSSNCFRTFREDPLR